MVSQLRLGIFNKGSFTMRATKPGSVTILCSQKLQPGYYFWFMFGSAQTFNINDIIFNDCTLSLGSSRGNATTVKSSFVNAALCTDLPGVVNVNPLLTAVFKQCTFSNNKGSRAILWSKSTNLTVDQSIFKNNFVCGNSTATSSQGGRAIYQYGEEVNIINSTFSNNEIANNYDGGAVCIYSRKAII